MSESAKLTRKELEALRNGWYELTIGYSGETTHGIIRWVKGSRMGLLRMKAWSRRVLAGPGRWEIDRSPILPGIGLPLRLCDVIPLGDGAFEVKTKPGVGRYVSLRMYTRSSPPSWATT